MIINIVLFFFLNTFLFQQGTKNDLEKYETIYNTVITNTSQ